MSPLPVYVQSLHPTGSKPVAVSIRPSDGSSAAYQWMIFSDVNSDVGATVRSYASSNPVAVAFTDPTGAHTTVVSVAGPIVASLVGQPTITASVPGPVPVTQQTSPWVSQPYGGTDTFRSAVTSFISTSADQLLVAGIVGRRHYVTAITVAVASMGGVVEVKDSGGVLWRTFLPAQEGNIHAAFPVPLRGTTTSSLLAACQESGFAAIFAVSAYDAV